MKFNKNKMMLFGTLMVSLLGVAVASISTAAWFQINNPGQSVTKNNIVQSGSSGLQIDSITGYKATYDEAGYGITDYTNGHVTPYNYYTRTGATVDDHVNLNQGGVTSYDLPNDGIGYYIVGDETWCATHNFNEEDAWKYASSLRMDEDPIYGNLAISKNIYLAAGTQFKIRHHYINNSNYTTDDWLGTLDDNSATTDHAQLTGGNVEIKSGHSGYYNIYYTTDNEISLYQIRAYNPASRNKKASKPIGTTRATTPTSGSSFDHIYLWLGKIGDSGNNWSSSSAKIFCHIWNGSSSADVELSWKQGDNYDAIWWVDVSSLTFEPTKLEFVRTSSSGTTSNMYDSGIKWNAAQTDWDSAYNYYKLTGWDACTKNTSDAVFDDANDYQSFTNGYYYYKTPNSSGGDWDDGKFTWLGSSLGSSKSLSFSANEYFKVIQLNNYRRLFSCVGYSGTKTWMNPENNITTNCSGSVSSTGNEGNCKANWAFSCTFTFTSEYKYNFALSNYTVTYVQYKYYHGASSPSETISTLTGTAYSGKSYTAIAVPNIAGYTKLGSTWYEDTACTDTYSPTTLSAAKTLYMRYDENSITITKTKVLMNNGGTTVNTTSSLGTETTYPSESFTPSTPAAVANYTFVGWFTASSGGTQISFPKTYTANTTIYARFKPTEYSITKSYKFFDSDGSTAVAGATNTVNPASDTAYAGTTYNPATPSSQPYTNTSNAIFYVFDFEGWYTNTACTTPYAAHTYSSSGTIYAKMVAKPYKTIYVETASVSWNSPYVKVFDVPDASTISSNLFSMKAVFGNTTFKVTLPNNYAFNITKNSSYGSEENQTVDISLDPDSIYNYDMVPKKRGSCDYVWILTDKVGNKRGFNWNNFYGEPSPNVSGMYLVGTQAFTGSSEVEWSFTAGIKMTEIPAGDRIGQYDGIAYKYENISLLQGMEFQIWQYSTSTGRGNMYNGTDLLTADVETTSIATNNASNNVEIRNVTGNKFAIYLTTTNKIKIVDNDRSTNILFSGELAEHEMSSFKMGYGDGTRVAIYELGITVTAADISSGRAEFAIRHRAGGGYHWYYWNDGYGSYNGLDSATSKGYVQTGSSRTYGETGAQNTCTGFKFKEAGSYKIYLLKNNSSTYEYTIAITQSPGPYGEGYYIVPYNTDWGSSLNGRYTNGVKMKTIEVANSDVQNNLAMYTCYSAKKDDQIILNYYINGRENYNYHKNPNAEQRIVALATDENTVAAIQTTAISGVFKFKKTGSYNIFVYKDVSDSNNYKISVAEYSVNDFFSLNSIAKNATDVFAANTSMVIEVDYTTTNTGYNVNTLLDMITPGTGLSNYVKFTYVVDPDLGAYTGYDYMRLNAQYSTLLAANVANNRKQTSSVNQESGAHKLFILIDYNQSQLSTLPNNPVADFYFVMKIRQVGA